jgi:hypothetical protein
MGRFGLARLLGALVAVLVAGACGGDGGGGGRDDVRNVGASAPAVDPGLRAAGTAVKRAKTVQATFTVRQVGATLTGDADVVSGRGKLVTFSHEVTVGDPGKPIKGRLLVVGDSAFERSTRWKLPKGRKWFAVNPGRAATPDEPIRPEWLALVMSRLLDPAFLLDQGVTRIDGVTATPDTLDGARVTRYTLSLNLGYQELGPELTAWARQIGDGTSFGVSLWLDARHRPVRLKLDGSTGLLQFWADVSFHHYGTDVSVKAPNRRTVARS